MQYIYYTERKNIRTHAVDIRMQYIYIGPVLDNDLQKKKSKKILSSAIFDGGGSVDRQLGITLYIYRTQGRI